MTQKAYEVFLDQLAGDLGMDKIETDETGGFVLELDESRWVLVAYSAFEDKLICQLCLEPLPRALELDDLRYLLRQNDLSHAHQQRHFALIQAEQRQERIVALLLRIAIDTLTPKTFLQSVEGMVRAGLGAEAYLSRTAREEPALPPINPMAIKA